MPTNKKSRRKLEREIGSLYKRAENVNLEQCFYCGDTRQVLDHVPPIAYTDKATPKLLSEKGVKLELVPCCETCNSILGSKAIITKEERVLFLWSYFSAKVEKLHKNWSIEEIKELGPNLKSFVNNKQKTIQFFIQKLRQTERRLCDLTYQDAA